jgi:Uma2 family endonuclease
VATTPTKLWTIDDLSAFEAIPGDRRHEVWRGELVELPVEGFRHSNINVRLATALVSFTWPAGLGTVTAANGGYVIVRDPLTLFLPDTAFVRADRLPGDFEGIPELAPDLVAEVVSPNDRMSDVKEKVAVYLAAGVPIVWVVYPEQRMVEVHRANQPNLVRQFHEGDELDGGEVLPGFRLPVVDIIPKR